MRKFIRMFLTVMIFTNIISTNVFAIGSEPPSISADGIVLMDADSGNVLYSKNLDAQYPPASTTKIMTALLVLENTDLDEMVTVGETPPFADGSKIYINEDEKLSMKDLLYALLLQSANDCAEAIAEHISGSTEEFAVLMNERAKELGCKNTNFVNPHGLYDDNHRTTAYDLALILKELWTYPEFVKIASTSMYYIEPTNKQSEQRPIWNKNRLVQEADKYFYEGAEGGKTGYTVQSKFSYVAVAQKDGVRLIAILLHDEAKTYWEDVSNLFDWGFENFSSVTMQTKGDSLGTYDVTDEVSISVVAAEDFKFLKDNSSTEDPTIEFVKKDLSETSFEKGDIILNAQVMLGDNKIGEIPVAADEAYSYKEPLFSKDNDNTEDGNSSSLLLSLLKYFGLALLVLIILLRIRKILRDRKRKKKRIQQMRKNMYFQRYYKK